MSCSRTKYSASAAHEYVSDAKSHVSNKCQFKSHKVALVRIFLNKCSHITAFYRIDTL